MRLLFLVVVALVPLILSLSLDRTLSLSLIFSGGFFFNDDTIGIFMIRQIE